MRSKTSFFNKAFSLHLLRRFWPLWALWLALLLAVGVGAPTGNPPESYASQALYVQELNRVLLDTGVALVYCAAAAGPLMAMFMLGYLYNPRSCGMVCALPMRREETYFTAVLTGLAPMLVCDVLVYLLLLARFGHVAGVETGHIHLWLALVVMGNAAFYGMGCFCGVLTGTAVVLPLVYVLLGFAAVVVESTVRELLGVLVYGYTSNGLWFTWLAPLPCLFGELRVVVDYPPTLPDGEAAQAGRELAYRVEGIPYLAGLCAAGLVLMLLAVLILRRRQMETAGDIVAVPLLRPLFRVCMAVGTGLFTAGVGCDGYFAQLLSGLALAAAAFALLVLGAALGWFIAEMLMRKTLRVFGRGWKPLGLVCALLVLPFLLAELDVTGYEKRVPDPAQVESVAFSYDSSETLTEPDSIAAACAFHRALIEGKAINDLPRGRQRAVNPTLRYTLKNGKTFSRSYTVSVDDSTRDYPASAASAYLAVRNLPEAILLRAGAGRDIRADTIRYAALDITHRDGRGWTSESIRLTPELAESLYREGILPDAREGNIERWYIWENAGSATEPTNVTLNLELFSEKEGETPDGRRVYDPLAHLDLNVLTCSAHSLQWLRDNLGLEPVSNAELQSAYKE